MPRWLAYGTPVFTVVAALAVSAVALVALSVDPVAAYSEMFVATLTDPVGLRQTAVRSVPLVLTGLAVYLPLRAGLWNVGAEGQLYAGAVVGTWLGLNVDLPAVAVVPLTLLGAGLAGAVWAGIPGYLKARWDINEIITTLLSTFVATEVANYLIQGPMQGGRGNFPVTDQLPSAATLPDIPGIGVHAGFLVALSAVLCTYVVLERTRLGFDVTVVGSNPLAGAQAGMSTFRVYMLVFLVGGAFAGLAGFSEVAGFQGRLRQDFSPGYGFTAIPIALLGRNGAERVLLAALFFALLFVGGSRLEVGFGVPAALIDIIQALVILFLITAEFLKRYAVDVELEREPTAAPEGEA